MCFLSVIIKLTKLLSVACWVVTERSACSADSTAFKKDVIAHTFPEFILLNSKCLAPPGGWRKTMQLPAK